MLTGGCLCGSVRYEIDPPVPFASICHCANCRKFSGTGYNAIGAVLGTAFRIVRGRELLRTFTPRGKSPRTFCTHCGSSLFDVSFEGPWPEIVSFFMGTLDADPGIRPLHHSWVSDKAPWDEITDDLPQYAREMGDD